MAPTLFGTDGVRGVANVELTPDLAFDLVRAAMAFLQDDYTEGPENPRVIVGRDTRLSGDMFAGSIAAALTSMGIHMVDMGVVPTPAVAHAVSGSRSALAGIVISASHNPPEYNGIKFFDAHGYKLSPEDEVDIEGRMGVEPARVSGAGLGRYLRGDGMVYDYLRHLRNSLGLSADALNGLRVAMDCSNGAGYRLGPAAFRSVGAEVTVIYDTPDGVNINVGCGSTQPEALVGMMLSGDYDVGFALDGDADRLVAVAPDGRVFDGDDILYIIAKEMSETGDLEGDTVVATMINNLGLTRCLSALGLNTIQCPVGDREIMIRMRQDGATLGGEISGHIIIGNCATTGDGILSALAVARAQVRTGSSLPDLVADFEKYPQIVKNVPVSDRAGLEDNEIISAAIEEARERLGGDGRIIVRASGTEPVVRVLIEGPSRDVIETIAGELAEVVKRQLG